MENPVFIIFVAVIGGYVASMWYSDYRAQRTSGVPNPGGLPGATPASVRACALAAIGALIILAGETYGEIVLGISEEQSDITVLFGLYTLVAAFIEEIIFRGYVVIANKGRAVLVGSIVAGSALFALAHPFLWSTDDGFHLTLTVKGWFSTAVVFLSSLWFYTVRFWPLNPERSLLPCFAAHFAKNLGVIAIKAAQGHVVGLW